MPHPHIRTPDQMATLLRPFVGTGRSIHRGDSAVDILHQSFSGDADIRSVDAAEIRVFFYDRCWSIPWASVRRIHIRGVDENGNTTSEVVYENAGALRSAA